MQRDVISNLNERGDEWESGVNNSADTQLSVLLSLMSALLFSCMFTSSSRGLASHYDR